MIYEYGEPWWNDIDRVKVKNSEKNPSQCHFFHHECHMACSERPVTNHLSHGMVF
jgi:hypothetical protein